jgi:hypothetical protein
VVVTKQKKKHNPNAGEDVKKKEPFYTFDGNINLYNYYKD